MFLITITDLSTGKTESFRHENVERLTQTGIVRADSDGPESPTMFENGNSTLLVKAFTSHDGSMDVYEDFVNFNDKTGGEPSANEDD